MSGRTTFEVCEGCLLEASNPDGATCAECSRRYNDEYQPTNEYRAFLEASARAGGNP